MADLVERLGEYSPKMVFAGEFPMLTDTGTAGEAVNQWILSCWMPQRVT